MSSGAISDSADAPREYHDLRGAPRLKKRAAERALTEAELRELGVKVGLRQKVSLILEQRAQRSAREGVRQVYSKALKGAW